MLTLVKPEGFTVQFIAVGCFLYCQEEFLILRRHPKKPQGGMWGLPAGKIEEGESLSHGMARELYEESGLCVDADDLGAVRTTYVHYGNGATFEFHVFHYSVNAKPSIRLDSQAHTEYAWVTAEQALYTPDLMEDFDSCIHLVDAWLKNAMLRYLNEADHVRLHAAHTFDDLLALALRILERMPRPLVYISGPLTTGGAGSLQANSLRIHAAREALQDRGYHVFDYMIFDEALDRIKNTHYPTDRYCVEMLEIFFRGIFHSGHISRVFFLPDWESSVGSRWERHCVLERGLEIADMPLEWLSDDTEKLLNSKK